MLRFNNYLLFAFICCCYPLAIAARTTASAEIIDAAPMAEPINHPAGIHLTPGHYFYNYHNYPYAGVHVAAGDAADAGQIVDGSIVRIPIVVQPYNIFDSIALCPAGYILAHNHCHKQVKNI